MRTATIVMGALGHGALVDETVADLDELEALKRRKITVNAWTKLKRLDPLQFYTCIELRALIVLVDVNWQDVLRKAAQEGAEDPDSLLRALEFAREYGAPVFLLLLGKAEAPRRAELPAEVAYLAEAHAITIRMTTDEQRDEDLFNALFQVMVQLGLIQVSLASVWSALGLAACEMAVIILLATLGWPWLLAAVGGALAVGLTAATERIAHSSFGFHWWSMMALLLGLVGVSGGGAYLFAVNALGATLAAQSLPLASLGAALLLVGLAAFGGIGIIVKVAQGQGRFVSLKSEQPRKSEVANFFLSYRRADSLAQCDRIEQYLNDRSKSVFRDFNALMVGADFELALERAIDSAEVILALIGPEWLTLRDAHGRRRIDDPLDYVHRELALALKRQKRIILLRLDGAQELTQSQLPVDLAGLPHCSRFQVRVPAAANAERRVEGHFNADMDAVMSMLSRDARRATTQLRQQHLGAIGGGLFGAAVFALFGRMLVWMCGVAPSAMYRPGVSCTVWWGGFGQLGASVCLVICLVGVWLDVVSTRRWRWLVGFIPLAGLSVAAYLAAKDLVFTIPARYANATVIGAWLVYIALAVDLIWLVTPLRMRLIRSRAQATLQPERSGGLAHTQRRGDL